MKYLLLVSFVLFLSVLTSAQSERCVCKTSLCRTNEAIKAISEQLRKKASPRAVPAKLLAPAILRASLKYGLDYHLLTSVVLLESRGIEKAYNRRTKDYGVGQINIHTANSLGLTMTCLMNYNCNLDATAKILSSISDGNICRYNVGTGKLIGKLLKTCHSYERKLASL